MKQDQEPFLRRVWKDRRGVVAILAALGIFAFVGFGAIVVDVAYVIDAHFALQAATNEAALAGAQDIGSGGTPLITAKNYSAYAGDMNVLSNITVASPTVSIQCLSGWGIACSTNQTPATSANIIEVTETATVPVFFANLFHAPPWSISATAVASAKGGAVGPFNVAFILDTTASMASLSGGTTGSACAGFSSAVDCAADGIQNSVERALALCPGNLRGVDADPVRRGRPLRVPAGDQRRSSHGRYRLHKPGNSTTVADHSPMVVLRGSRIFRGREYSQRGHDNQHAFLGHEYDGGHCI